MRIAIVNDLRMAQEVLRKAVAAIPDASLAWIAADGHQALLACKKERPDLILMDMVMPVMDGAVATRAIMKECPCPILVVTSTIEGNLSLVYEALSAGAIDAVQTPQFAPDGSITGLDSLIRKSRVAIAASAAHGAGSMLASQPAPTRPATTLPSARLPLLAIGSSTGGPHALSVVLRGLTSHNAYSTVVVQHLDAAYAAGLATWLSREINRPVRTAAEGDRLRCGETLIAATNDHLIVRDGCAHYVAEPVDQIYRPSVDAFFHSIVRDPSVSGTAVLLTGMGRDGAEGMRSLRQAGWHTIAQDAATSIVWGMPGAAVALGAAIEVLSIDMIGPAASRSLARHS
ncbi:MAG: chemotaxis-specific protein-glutamate methyltransferase CheB [Phycisphaerales bacterium]|nr:chemotaxis-specific protein-glutamate methyltransferase CheB [Phycisphaerales bacterium]